MNDGGKGSAPRPFSVDNETFNKNFDAIFRNKNSSSSQCSVAEAATSKRKAKEKNEKGEESPNSKIEQ